MNVGDEELVHPGNKAAARQPCDHGTERRHCRQHHEEGSCKQPLQVAYAAGDPHFVPQRAQHIIACKQEEEIAKGPGERPTFPGPHHDGPLQPAL
jgi:hypothetical protein